MLVSLALNSDSYKSSHYLQYPPGTQAVSSYIESRGGRYPQTVFFGLQAFLKQTLLTPVTKADVDEAADITTAHGVPFNRDGWQRIVDRWQGRIPVRIQALPEGIIATTGTALVQVVNTDRDLPWLTSYIETALLRAIWYPTTVATVSWTCKQIIARYLADTADSTAGLPFKLHDFGARGASSQESAAIGGLAHLVNFQGTDTLSAIVAARRYYGEPMAGFSIPAAEHSTITSWGRDGEGDAYANMLDQFAGPQKILAVVSDSWDLWNAIDTLWGQALKERVLNSGGTVVVRPDSGDPVEVAPRAVEKLMDAFGYTVNTKGYRVLPDCVRVIQGDGVSATSIDAILASMKARGLSADNIAFGMGGELLQKVNRDTQRFAMKASAISIEGVWHDVYKDPVTDPDKRSKRGRLAVIRNARGALETIREDALGDQHNLLQTVYENGELLIDDTLAAIRARTQ